MFDFIRCYFLEHRSSPLIRDVQLGCQISSYKSAIDRLNALEHKGFIRRIPNKHRGIKLVRKLAQPQQPYAEVPSSPASPSPFPSMEGAA